MEPQNYKKMYNQEDVWSRVVGFRPEVGRKYEHPFRSKKTISTEWQWDHKGYLRMKDWGDDYYHNINIFDAVAIKILGHKIDEVGSREENLASVKQFITGSNIRFETQSTIAAKVAAKKAFSFDLQAMQRPFTDEELSFYRSFGITETNLVEDKITGCEWYKHNSVAQPTQYHLRYPQDPCVIQWAGDRKKIYRPFNKAMKFTTDTKGDDIWVFGSGGLALIFEGHKDARVAHNLGFNTIGLQSSTILPSPQLMQVLVSRFEDILYVGDWDQPGIKNGMRIANSLGIQQAYFPEPVRSKLITKNLKDISDLYRAIGRERTINAVKYIINEYQNSKKG